MSERVSEVINALDTNAPAALIERTKPRDNPELLVAFVKDFGDHLPNRPLDALIEFSHIPLGQYPRHELTLLALLKPFRND